MNDRNFFPLKTHEFVTVYEKVCFTPVIPRVFVGEWGDFNCFGTIFSCSFLSSWKRHQSAAQLQMYKFFEFRIQSSKSVPQSACIYRMLANSMMGCAISINCSSGKNRRSRISIAVCITTLRISSKLRLPNDRMTLSVINLMHFKYTLLSSSSPIIVSPLRRSAHPPSVSLLWSCCSDAFNALMCLDKLMIVNLSLWHVYDSVDRFEEDRP